jgi:1,5-anhydro-D-fructose reductase (1,5-anhydro-D-mannitol-forming)
MAEVATLRWGVIGCGAVCEVKSVPAYQQQQAFSVVGASRRDHQAAADFARRHQIATVFESAQELIAHPSIDAVYVATPPDSHLALALLVAAAGKPCCVEKPMAMNFAQCKDMLEAFERANVPLFVAYYRRSLPRFLQAKSWLDSGRIGKVRSVHWQLTRPPNCRDLLAQSNWRTDPKIAGGGYFVDLASHGLDLLQFLLGDIAEVSGITSNVQGLYAAEDMVCASWKFASGAIGTGVWNFAARNYVDAVEIIGSEGTLSFSVFEDRAVELASDVGFESVEIENPHHLQSHHVDNIAAHLAGAIRHPALGIEAAKTNRVMDLILS